MSDDKILTQDEHYVLRGNRPERGFGDHAIIAGNPEVVSARIHELMVQGIQYFHTLRVEAFTPERDRYIRTIAASNFERIHRPPFKADDWPGVEDVAQSGNAELVLDHVQFASDRDDQRMPNEMTLRAWAEEVKAAQEREEHEAIAEHVNDSYDALELEALYGAAVGILIKRCTKVEIRGQCAAEIYMADGGSFYITNCLARKAIGEILEQSPIWHGIGGMRRGDSIVTRWSRR